MKITQTFVLSKREVEFLIALNTKKHFKNMYGGWMEDDDFRKEWNAEIKAFSNNKLTEHLNTGPDAYWCYQLTAVGCRLQEAVISGETITDFPVTLEVLVSIE